jgi:hypothetical protein
MRWLVLYLRRKILTSYKDKNCLLRVYNKKYMKKKIIIIIQQYCNNAFMSRIDVSCIKAAADP